MRNKYLVALMVAPFIFGIYFSSHRRSLPPEPYKTRHPSGTTTWIDEKFTAHARDELGLPMAVTVYMLETKDKKFARLIVYNGSPVHISPYAEETEMHLHAIKTFLRKSSQPKKKKK